MHFLAMLIATESRSSRPRSPPPASAATRPSSSTRPCGTEEEHDEDIAAVAALASSMTAPSPVAGAAVLLPFRENDTESRLRKPSDGLLLLLLLLPAGI